MGIISKLRITYKQSIAKQFLAVSVTNLFARQLPLQPGLRFGVSGWAGRAGERAAAGLRGQAAGHPRQRGLLPARDCKPGHLSPSTRVT
eukprot:scaffold36646_cov18-Prasinocladus_malaysianus.AAC.1